MSVRFPWRYARPLKFALDLAAWTLTIPLAFFLRLDTEAWASADAMLALVMVAVPLQAFVIYRSEFHRQSWGVVSGADIRRIVPGVAAVTAVLFAEAWILQRFTPVPRSVALISGALALIALCGMRLAVRWVNEERARSRTGGQVERRVLILGAGDAGSALARDIQRSPESGMRVVGFLDDDPSKRQLLRAGLPVLGSLEDLPAVFARTNASEALFAIPTSSMSARRAVFELAERSRIPLRSVPSVPALLASRTPAEVRDVLSGLVVDGSGRNILLIGGAGYIGSALVPLLLDRGYKVRVLDLLIYGDEAIAPYIGHPRFELVHGDFRQVDKVVESLTGIDTVIHLGGLVGDPACALDEDLTVEINLMATKMIAEVAKGYGVSRFIFASTCSVYGESDEVLDEGSALNPLSLYARTKLGSERLLLRMADARFSPTILRFGTVYGFSGRTRFDLVVNLLTAKAATEGVITLYGGDQWRPFVHVHDVAKAVLITVSAPATITASRIYNVGSDEQNQTLAQVAKLVHAHVPASRIVDHGANTDKRNYRVSFRAIHDELGFKPDWTLDMGIDQVLEALKTGRVKDYRLATYSNVAYLTDEGLSKILRGEMTRAREVLLEQA